MRRIVDDRGFAFAGDGNVSAAQILNALQPKPSCVPLGRSEGRAGPRRPIPPQGHGDELPAGPAQRKTRSLSLSEREQIAEIATPSRTSISRSLRLQLGSISTASMLREGRSAKRLGCETEGLNLRGRGPYRRHRRRRSTRISASAAQRRSTTIWSKNTLSPMANLVAVGYGKTKLKDASIRPTRSTAAVQVVNMEAKTASKYQTSSHPPAALTAGGFSQAIFLCAIAAEAIFRFGATGAVSTTASSGAGCPGSASDGAWPLALIGLSRSSLIFAASMAGWRFCTARRRHRAGPGERRVPR